MKEKVLSIPATIHLAYPLPCGFVLAHDKCVCNRSSYSGALLKSPHGFYWLYGGGSIMSINQIFAKSIAQV